MAAEDWIGGEDPYDDGMYCGCGRCRECHLWSWYQGDRAHRGQFESCVACASRRSERERGKMQRIDQDESERYWKVMVYGDSGSGKTSLGVTAQSLGPTLVLLSERQGMAAIRHAARRLGMAVPTVLLMTEMGDYRAVANALHGRKDLPFKVVNSKGETLLELEQWPVTVVLDSVTDAVGNMLVASIRRQAPQKKDDDGLPIDADRFYNVLRDKTSNFATEFRDCPVNILFLALLDDKEVGKGKDAKRRVGPKFPMKGLDAIFASATNVVGQSYRTISGGKPVFQVATLTPGHILTKACEPLRPIEVPDFGEWVRRLNDHSAPATPTSLEVTDDLEGAVPSDAQPAAAVPSPSVEDPRVVKDATAALDAARALKTRVSARREVSNV